MKKAMIIVAGIFFMALAIWMSHRTEIDFGRVLNSQGDGKLYNGEPFYNYICYDQERFQKDDIVLTICFLNPFNNYCDDILVRTDFRILKDTR